MWEALLRTHAELHPTFPADPWGQERATALAQTLERELRDPDVVLLLAVEASAPPPAPRPVGFCLARRALAPAPIAEESRGHLDEIWVDPAWRRRGLGRRLVRAALEVLRVAGVTRVEVRVLHANQGALGFWDALGFEPFVDVLERRLQRL
jgi:ribosomal protein S18 acetylase RimI-like enzyme